ncbi:MAG: Gfo/Idh/MocA family protein [Prochlorotrichaceae cyanobacterium]
MTAIAILGAGRWGTHLLRNFLRQEQAQVVAIVDPNPQRLAQIQTQFSLSPSIQRLTDWRSLWTSDFQANTPLDAIVVATPASTHFEIIEAALRHNLHVLAEKPLTLTVAESEQLTALADRQQRQLVIDHTYLFHPAVEAGRKICPELGTLRYGYASRTHLGPVRQDVDVLWDLAIHDIAIVNHWLGAYPLEVRAIGQQWLPNPGGSAEDSPALADLVWATLIYPGGVTIQLHFCWNNPDKQRRLVLVGDRGALIFDELAADPLLVQRGYFREVDGFPFTPTDLQREAIVFPSQEPLAEVCRHFLDCIAAGQSSPISNGTIGTELVRILVALSRSLEQNGLKIAVR